MYMYHSYIYLLHIFFGGPLLLYGGYYGKLLSEKHNDEEYINIFLMLIFTGLLIIFYHGYKFLKIKGLIQNY